MKENGIAVGSVVLSTQGRDKGGYFLVTAVGENFVLIADGGSRKLSAPKKKNVKHISDSGVKLEMIAQKLAEGKKVFDSEVKSALRQLNQQNREGE